MLSGLMDIEEGDRLLPFVRLFYSDPSTFLWGDEVGDTHEIRQGEGGEQGDALTPLVFSFGGRRAFVCPDRVQAVYQTMVQELWDHARISLHNGMTRCGTGEASPPVVCPTSNRWLPRKILTLLCGGNTFLPTSRQGLLILGTPVGTMILSKCSSVAGGKSRWFVAAHQAAWLLLTSCAAVRANFTLRTVRPALVEEFAASHNHASWTCLVKILGIDGSAVWQPRRQ